jgi:hypothetical protein
MIYSGHATMKHISRAQEPPAVMRRILEAVRSGFADVIFIYRHPLDSCSDKLDLVADIRFATMGRFLSLSL